MRRVLPALICALSLAFFSPAIAKDTTPETTLVLELPTGNVTIAMRPDLAPRHVEQIKTLTRQGFYDGLAWFRVIDGFMAQTGHPKARNRGGKSDLPDLPDEFSRYVFKRGTVGMGRSDKPDSANSQFFICLTDNGCRDLTGNYTAWGQVISGMDHVDALKRGEPPRDPDETVRAYIAADGPAAVKKTAPRRNAGND